MRLSRTIGKFVAVVALASSAIVAQAQDSGDSWTFPDFTAIQRLGLGQKSLTMKVYWSGANVRVEESPTLADLYLPATGNVYRLTVYPDKTRQCIVMTAAQAKDLLPHPLELLHGTKVKRTPAGTDTVDGHSCKVENVVVTKADGRTIESKVWEADDFKGAPVKIESTTEHGKIGALYGDITFAPLDKALFTAPDKCIPYDKMGQVVEQKIVQ